MAKSKKQKELSKEETFAALEKIGFDKVGALANSTTMDEFNDIVNAVAAGEPVPQVNDTKTVVVPMDEKQAGLVTNSVLVRIGFGVLGNSKKANVEVKTSAEQTRFKVHKMLLDSPELKAITKADMKIR